VKVTGITGVGASIVAGLVAGMPSSEAWAAADFVPGVTYRYVEVATYGPGTPVDLRALTSQTTYYAITFKNGAAFGGRRGLVDEHTVYAQAAGSPQELTFDQFIGFTRAGAITQSRMYGYQSFSSTTTQTETLVETFPGGSVGGETPERAGQTWSPPADYSGTYSMAGRGGLAGKSAAGFGRFGADGSYAVANRIRIETSSKRFAWDYNEALYSDGAGVIVSDETGYEPGSAWFGLPARSGRGFVIPVTTEGGNPQPGPPSPKKTVDVPDWFPGGARAPHPLASTVDVDTGETRTPAGCGARSGLLAYDIHETNAALDPIQGFYSVQTSDQYDSPALGIVCTITYWNTYTYNNYGNGLGSFFPEVDTTILLSETGPHAVNLAQTARLRRASQVAAGDRTSNMRGVLFTR
jgi:hypothetical protein